MRLGRTARTKKPSQAPLAPVCTRSPHGTSLACAGGLLETILLCIALSLETAPLRYLYPAWSELDDTAKLFRVGGGPEGVRRGQNDRGWRRGDMDSQLEAGRRDCPPGQEIEGKGCWWLQAGAERNRASPNLP